MTTGVGTDVAVGFAIETTPETREAPNTFVEILSESMTVDQVKIPSGGLGGGRQIVQTSALGNKTVGGSISMELRNAGMADLLRLCIGGDPTPSGADPYTRVYEGGGVLPTSTWQIVRPYSPVASIPFDYIGCQVNQWTLTQSANEFANLQVELYAHNELTDQTAATFAPPAVPDLFTFANFTASTPDGEVCFDSVSVTGANSLGRTFKACADAPGLAHIHPDGKRSVTGTLTGDFENITAYNRYLSNTEGTLTLTYEISASKQLVVAMNIVYTGETPTVGGPGLVKQGIPFMVQSATSDADAITVTLVNGEA